MTGGVKTSPSLRVRLTVVILVPLMLVAALVGVWAYWDAEANAAERFDRSLLSTALAISRDTAATGGDALSEETRDLLRDTSGGRVFYHVYAPDGVFVTGYATPPVPPESDALDAPQRYFDAVYFGEAVRALRFTQQGAIDGLSGLFTYTVWQETTVRDGFVRTRTGPVFAIIASLVGALAVIVWFGVRLGLAPLVDLEEAIERRSVDDLSAIKRRIPSEVTGIVGRLNALLSELSISMTAKDAFISDAAHQLRNPIAGVIALAESVVNAADPDQTRARARDLRGAAQDLGHLTNSLLTLERIHAGRKGAVNNPFDAVEVVSDLVEKAATLGQPAGVRVIADLPSPPVVLSGDPVMFEQAIFNVLNNALLHGGPQLSQITVQATAKGDLFEVVIADDGKGIDPTDFERALGRFSQVGPSAGSGLGLPIAAAVAQSYDGGVDLSQERGTFRVTCRFHS